MFELLRQGRYQEAVSGFHKRVQEKRADSRDYYGLAVGYEQLKDINLAWSFARTALHIFQADRRMSEKEAADCERIAKLAQEQPPRRDEQAELFELLRQGRYQEAISGFQKRATEQRANSRDYYGLAVAYEQLKETKQAVTYAYRALSLNQDDRKLSKEEQDDARRIAQREK